MTTTRTTSRSGTARKPRKQPRPRATTAHDARRALPPGAARASSELDPWLTRQRLLLEQIRLCDQILAGAPKDAATSGLHEARAHLLSLVAERQAPRATLHDVDPSAPEAERVATFWPLLGAVVADMDGAASAAARKNIQRFLLHVAWHEGLRLTRRVQLGNGPARSFFQLEAHRAKEAALYARREGWVSKLATAAGTTDQLIDSATNALPTFDPNDPNGSARFPVPNDIETALRTRDLFGIYLTRIAFKSVPEAVPTTNAGHATYWYRYWKRSGGDPSQLKRIFEDASDQVDLLIPA